jgi:hypothetical protein
MEEWTCTCCGDAFFGIPPERRLCIACQEEIGETPTVVGAWAEVKADISTGRDEELRAAEQQLHDEIRAYRLDRGEGGPS